MSLPKVSVQLPCGYGNEFVETAIDCYVDQKYAGETELILLDNNTTPLLWAADLPFVSYYRCKRMPLGALRNLANSYAMGDIIIHFDEDDWSHPDRIATQVDRLLTTGKAVTGFHSFLFYSVVDGGTYRYHYSDRSHEPYGSGATLAYTREWWVKHPFVETGIEDRPFTDAALATGQLDSCDGGQLLVCRVHGHNLVQKQLGHRQFPAVDRSTFPPEFFPQQSL